MNNVVISNLTNLKSYEVDALKNCGLWEAASTMPAAIWKQFGNVTFMAFSIFGTPDNVTRKALIEAGVSENEIKLTDDDLKKCSQINVCLDRAYTAMLCEMQKFCDTVYKVFPLPPSHKFADEIKRATLKEALERLQFPEMYSEDENKSFVERALKWDYFGGTEINCNTIGDKGDEVANALWAIAEALEDEKGGEDNADC